MRRLRWSVISLALLALFAPTIARAGERRRIPEVIDLPQAAADAELRVAGFRPRAVPSTAPGPAGTVAAQSPGGFWWAESGTEVTIEIRGLAAGPTPGSTIPGGTPTIPTPAPPRPGATPIVPAVVGRTESEAVELLKDWRITILNVAAAPGTEGRVVDQTPAAGTPLAANETITISVGGAGAPPVGASAVPNVVGMSVDAATAALKAARLVPLVNTVPADAASAGRVTSQEPGAGIVVARDSNVVINVGAGAPTSLLETEVPDLRRLSELEARSRLAAAGLTPQVEDRLARAEEANLVVAQSPIAGARVQRNAVVTVTIGRLLMLPIGVPELLNVDATEAERTLRDLGFAVERATATSLPGSVGRIIGQVPAAGTSAIRGSVVRITVGIAQPVIGSSVPDVAGLPEAAAAQRLQAAGFAVVRATIPGNPADAGTVRGTQPVGGSALAKGGTVTLIVVEAPTAPATMPLPNYVGMDAGAAQADLLARGLQVALLYVVSVPEGRVVAQNPPLGTPVGRGAAITLTVSRSPTLGQVILLDPPSGTSVPKNYGVLFRWSSVPEAEDYEFEIFKWKDDTWVVADHDMERRTEKRPSRVRTGQYQWHVRARRANGAIVGAWSEWRRLTIY